MTKALSITIKVSIIAMAVSKLLGLIDWSWWIVTAPLWGTVLLAMGRVVWIGIYRGLKIRIYNALTHR